MIPMAAWLLGGAAGALLGYRQYIKVKPGDTIIASASDTPGLTARIRVREVSSDGSRIIGSLIESNTNIDTGGLVTLARAQVVENLTPRFW
jgi:hypothetical protein